MAPLILKSSNPRVEQANSLATKAQRGLGLGFPNDIGVGIVCKRCPC